MTCPVNWIGLSAIRRQHSRGEDLARLGVRALPAALRLPQLVEPETDARRGAGGGKLARHAAAAASAPSAWNAS